MRSLTRWPMQYRWSPDREAKVLRRLKRQGLTFSSASADQIRNACYIELATLDSMANRKKKLQEEAEEKPQGVRGLGCSYVDGRRGPRRPVKNLEEMTASILDSLDD